MASQDMFGQSGDVVASSTPNKKRQRKQARFWEMAENNALVHAVENHECIWNPAHQDYKNGKLKKVIWKKIRNIDGLADRSARECCDRWGVMRTAYKRKVEQKFKSDDGASTDHLVLPEPYCHINFLAAAVETSKARVDTMNINDGENLSDGSAGSIVNIDGRPTPRVHRKTARKVQHDWTHEETLCLISAVEHRPALWDVGSADYKIYYRKEDTWGEVAREVGNGIDSNEAKFKWGSIRVTFKTNLLKLRAKKSGQATSESFSVTWRYFQYLMFLEDNDVNQSFASTSSMPLESAITDHSILDDLALVQSPTAPGIPYTVGQMQKRRHSGKTTTATSSPSPSTDYKNMKEMAAHAFNILQGVDRFSIFGNFVASELRRMNEDKAEMLQSAIMRTMLEQSDLRRLNTRLPPPQNQHNIVRPQVPGTNNEQTVDETDNEKMLPELDK